MCRSERLWDRLLENVHCLLRVSYGIIGSCGHLPPSEIILAQADLHIKQFCLIHARESVC